MSKKGDKKIARKFWDEKLKCPGIGCTKNAFGIWATDTTHLDIQCMAPIHHKHSKKLPKNYFDPGLDLNAKFKKLEEDDTLLRETYEEWRKIEWAKGNKPVKGKNP